MRIELLRRALEANPDDVESRVRLVEEVDALGEAWSSYALLVELQGAAPRRVRAWALRRLARRLEATGHPLHALAHLLDAQALAPRRATNADIERLAPHADALRFAYVAATTPRTVAWLAPNTTTLGRWRVAGATIELRRVVDPAELELPALVLVARPPDGSPALQLAHVGDEYDSSWTTVERVRIRRVHRRPQLVLEGEVSSTYHDACELAESRAIFTLVCELPADGRVGGCVRVVRGASSSWSSGRHHDFPEHRCFDGMTYRPLRGEVELGELEMGSHGIRWRGAASLPWLRTWRSIEELREGATEWVRDLPRPTHLDGPLPPRAPIESE